MPTRNLFQEKQARAAANKYKHIEQKQFKTKFVDSADVCFCDDVQSF